MDEKLKGNKATKNHPNHICANKIKSSTIQYPLIPRARGPMKFIQKSLSENTACQIRVKRFLNRGLAATLKATREAGNNSLP